MIVFFAIVLILLTWWLHRRLVRATAMPRPWSLMVDVLLVVFAVLAAIGLSTGRVLNPAVFRAPAFLGLTWLAALLYLGLGVIIIGIGSLLWRLVARLSGHSPGAARLRAVRISTAIVAIGAVVATAYGVLEAHSPRTTTTSITLPGLPTQFDGVRVALISDLHVGPARGRAFTKKVVDQVNATHPDLIVIAGDVTDGTVANTADAITPLAELSAPLGVFGVSGNHEFYSDDGGAWLDEWERLGVRTLRNQRVEVSRNGASIDVVGIHDYSAPAPYQPDLPAALDGSDPQRFALLLAHEPRQAEQASQLGIDVQLSGHTHGGQLWPIRYLVSLQQPSVQGLDRIGDTALYTTFGAGAWGPPVRVGAPPEIALVQLRRG